MNRQGKDGIEWTDWSWSPVSGCNRGCWYCYGARIAKRFHRSFEPEFHPERLGELDKLKKPAKIFVCSVADIFAKWTKKEWRDLVLSTIQQEKYSHLTFQLLTKNPECIERGANYGKNVWVGVTATDDDETDKMYSLVNNYDGNKFISFEPLLGPVSFSRFNGYIDKIDWIIVGKLTGSRKVKLKKKWVEYIISQARSHRIPIFIKNNIGWPKKIQQFPKGMI